VNDEKAKELSVIMAPRVTVMVPFRVGVAPGGKDHALVSSTKVCETVFAAASKSAVV